MAKLTIVARITAKPDQIEFMKKELEKLVEPTRAEEGCLQYDLHQDDESPAHFLFYENWTTREHWLAHMENDHLAAYKAATEDAVEDFALYEMTHIQ